jgi:hypothetical protein
MLMIELKDFIVDVLRAIVTKEVLDFLDFYPAVCIEKGLREILRDTEFMGEECYEIRKGILRVLQYPRTAQYWALHLTQKPARSRPATGVYLRCHR